jgi:hypothetical protein
MEEKCISETFRIKTGLRGRKDWEGDGDHYAVRNFIIFILNEKKWRDRIREGEISLECSTQ